MKKFVYFNVLLIFCFTACKKDKDPSAPVVPEPTAGNYSPLSIGSYWIYERFEMDTNGVETVTSVDSSYISGDTVIHGDTFSVFVGSVISPTNVYYRRDSSGYLLDQFWTIHFSKTNFTDTLRTESLAGYYNIYYKMIVTGSITTPAGAFGAYDYLGTVNILVPGYLWDNPRYMHSYYADGIGLIRETSFFLMGPGYIGRRLLRYHIE